MESQSFNLSSDFLGGYTEVFIRIVMAIVLLYGFILIVNFFRDKFVKKESLSQEPHIVDLLSILNKLFYFSGLGLQ